MAKIKVHELAKEVDKQSKEVIAFLQNKGIEVKAAQSSVEEDAAQMVRKAFAQKSEAAKPEPETSEKEAVKAPVSEPKQEPEKKTEAKAEEKAKQPVKKKKNIIFVSNPHNSKMPGGQRQGGFGGSNGNNGNNGNNRNGGNNGRRNDNSMNRPLIRPLTPPSPTPSVGQIKPTQPVRQNRQQEQNREVKEAAAVKETSTVTREANAPAARNNSASSYRQQGNGENRQERKSVSG